MFSTDIAILAFKEPKRSTFHRVVKTIFYPQMDHRLKFGIMHMLLVWVLFYVGFVLSMPDETFASSRAYYYFNAIATKNQWACFFLSMAAIGALGLRWPSLRVFSAHTLSIAHLILALLIGFSNPHSIATGTYLGLACVGFVYLWNEKRNWYTRVLPNAPQDLGHYVSAAAYRHQQQSIRCKYME